MKRTKTMAWTAGCAVCLIVAAFPGSSDRGAALAASPAAATDPEVRLIHTVWISGLSNPWDLAFAPNGSLNGEKHMIQWCGGNGTGRFRSVREEKAGGDGPG